MKKYLIILLRKIKVIYDIFSDYLEKTVDGNEKHSLSFLFKQFYDSGVENGKIDSNDILRSININETIKKDVTEITQQLINKIDVNNSIANGKDVNIKALNKKNKKKSNNVQAGNNIIHMESQNNFSNEKVINKFEKDLSQNNSSQMSNQNLIKGLSVLKKDENKEISINTKVNNIDYNILNKKNSNTLGRKKNIYDNNIESDESDDEKNFMDKSDSDEDYNIKTRNKNKYNIQPRKVGRKKKSNK